MSFLSLRKTAALIPIQLSRIHNHTPLTPQIRHRVQKLDHLAPKQPRACGQAVAAADEGVAQPPLLQAAVVVEHGQAVDDEQGGLCGLGRVGGVD